ncbi:hypothetical protein 65p393 [Aeromonas phage 65]|uniref:Uncharacterized protein n=1 Tax=Aeromonas phage 65 TaxID=2919549 RepID=E5DSM7_9CAUD|nr:hypothetical protein ST65p393 [Aeromonas phage 65]ADQ53400.1 hypothetical protein 65p393 [Aeromonas phage 65]
MQSFINTIIIVCLILFILFVWIYTLEKYRNWKLKNIPTHYKNALAELGYDIYCNYKNQWFTCNKWGIKKCDHSSPIVVFSADEFYLMLKGCFTYTTNKIYVDSEKVSRLFEKCNTLPRTELKEW